MAHFRVSMNVQVEHEPHCVAKLRIELPPEKVAAAAERIAGEFRQHARIPGFRPGKAPRAMVEKRFRKEIREELERSLVGDGCREAIKREGLKVLSLAEVGEVVIGPGSGAQFTARLITVPEFALPEYKGLPVKVEGTAVTPAEVDEAIEGLRNRHAEFSDLPERPLAMGDYAVIDYRGTVDGRPVDEVFPKAGKPLAGNDDFWLRLTDEAFLPGFCPALVGARPGETRVFPVTVPADFALAEMAGSAIEYAVTVRAIKEKRLPELDDAFAYRVVPGRTLAQLREMTAEELARGKRLEVERAKRNQVIEQLLGAVTCDLPERMVRNEMRRILTDIVRENQARGVAEEVLKEHEGELFGAAAQSAQDRVKTTFILLRIAGQEGIEAGDDEVRARVARLAQRAGMAADKLWRDLERREALDDIRQEMVTGKALDFLVANATVEQVAAAADA